MESVGIEWNGDSIKFDGDGPGSLRILSLDDIQTGQGLASIPKDACLTVYNTEISDILAEEELGGGLGLVIAVWLEKQLGSKSKWAGYFASCPESEYLPVFWTDDQLKWLSGTEIENMAVQDRMDIAEDYDTHVIPLLQKYPDALGRSMKDTSLSSFIQAASLVASRAFAVDEEHGDGMVPLADVFNHKASVVQLSADYGIHGVSSSSSSEVNGNSGDDVSDEIHSDQVISEDNTKIESEDESDVQLPVILDQTEVEFCGLSEANGITLKLHIAIIDDSRNDSLQIIASTPVEKNHEIYNTYGELGNAELVKKYGFCLAENPFTKVSLCKDKQFLEQIERWFGGIQRGTKKKKRNHETIGSTKGILDSTINSIKNQTELLDNDSEEPFYLYPQGHINISLYIFIYLIIYGVKKEFLSVEDALKEDFIKAALQKTTPIQLDEAISDFECFGQKLDNESDSSQLEGFNVRDMVKEFLVPVILQRLSRYPNTHANSSEIGTKTDSTRNEATVAYTAATTLRNSEMQILRYFLESLGARSYS
eukprot:jgi/Picsp_1/5605/NSC_02964-R1_set domain-containing protein